ncbi:MAG TPA: hypothetical protein VGX21_07730 [Methylomirabilota bacterium]|nr:hypothetical protein [Methylomirabilota bacterium]
MRRGLALTLVGLLLGPPPAVALLPTLAPGDVQAALEAGQQGVAQEDFGEEWRVPLPDGAEIVVTTPFGRLAHAARQAAFKGEPLAEKQRQEQLERGKGKLQLLVTMVGVTADFARWLQPLLRVGEQEVKASFTQNERTALRLDDGRFAARNVYVFPLEGLPPRGTVTLIVQHTVQRRVVLRAPIDLSKMR